MNILFIEDERELAATGVAQLELKGYTVFPAYDVADAQAVMDDSECEIHFIIADHRLPDGEGIQFVIDTKASFPLCKCAVVSGCLSERNISDLKQHNIPYYRKPLLYGKVIEEMRRLYAKQAVEYVAAEPEVPNAGELLSSIGSDAQGADYKFWPFK